MKGLLLNIPFLPVKLSDFAQLLIDDLMSRKKYTLIQKS